MTLREGANRLHGICGEVGALTCNSQDLTLSPVPSDEVATVRQTLWVTGNSLPALRREERRKLVRYRLIPTPDDIAGRVIRGPIFESQLV